MLAGGGDGDKLRGECFEAGSFGRSICSGRWGTFLVLQGEEDGGCHRLLPPPDRERGHTRPSALWGPCHGRGSQNPRAQPGARGTQKVPLRGGLSQIFHCDWHLSVAFTWRRSPPVLRVLSQEGFLPSACGQVGSNPDRGGGGGGGRSQEAAGIAPGRAGAVLAKGPTPTLGWALFLRPARPGISRTLGRCPQESGLCLARSPPRPGLCCSSLFST